MAEKNHGNLLLNFFCHCFFTDSCTHALSHTHTHTHACHPSPSDNCIRPFRVRIPPNLRPSELQKSLIHCLIGAKYDRKDDKLFFSSSLFPHLKTFLRRPSKQKVELPRVLIFFSSVSSIPVTIEDSQAQFFCSYFATLCSQGLAEYG